MKEEEESRPIIQVNWSKIKYFNLDKSKFLRFSFVFLCIFILLSVLSLIDFFRIIDYGEVLEALMMILIGISYFLGMLSALIAILKCDDETALKKSKILFSLFFLFLLISPFLIAIIIDILSTNIIIYLLIFFLLVLPLILIYFFKVEWGKTKRIFFFLYEMIVNIGLSIVASFLNVFQTYDGSFGS